MSVSEFDESRVRTLVAAVWHASRKGGSIWIDYDALRDAINNGLLNVVVTEKGREYLGESGD